MTASWPLSRGRNVCRLCRQVEDAARSPRLPPGSLSRTIPPAAACRTLGSASSRSGRPRQPGPRMASNGSSRKDGRGSWWLRRKAPLVRRRWRRSGKKWRSVFPPRLCDRPRDRAAHHGEIVDPENRSRKPGSRSLTATISVARAAEPEPAPAGEATPPDAPPRAQVTVDGPRAWTCRRRSPPIFAPRSTTRSRGARSPRSRSTSRWRPAESSFGSAPSGAGSRSPGGITRP